MGLNKLEAGLEVFDSLGTQAGDKKSGLRWTRRPSTNAASVTFPGEVAKRGAMAMPSAAQRRLVSISTGSRGGWEFTKTEIHEQRGKMQGEWLVTF